MSSLRDQVALVTGSSRGIGAAIAKSFAQQGAKVVIHGRDGAALSSIRKEIELAGGRSMQVGGDPNVHDSENVLGQIHTTETMAHTSVHRNASQL